MKKKIFLSLIAVIIVIVIITLIKSFLFSNNNDIYYTDGIYKDLVIHNKFSQVNDADNKLYYYIEFSYKTTQDKVQNKTLRISSQLSDESQSLLFDSLFTNKSYNSLEYEIIIPNKIAKENGLLNKDINGEINSSNYSLIIENFFNCEDDFIKKYMEITSIQAEFSK